MKPVAPESASIAAGAVSALGASVCRVLPLVAISIGLGGAWIAQLRELERFFYLFAGIAVAAFAFAFYRLYLRPAPCAPEGACEAAASRRGPRIAFWTTLVAAKASVRKILERLPGVAEPRAGSSSKRAGVTYDPDQVSPTQLAEALAKNGHPASVRP